MCPPVSHLLIVDDDLEVLDLLRKFFVQQGYVVDVATDGVALPTTAATLSLCA